jgi:hypothetical protein
LCVVIVGIARRHDKGASIVDQAIAIVIYAIAADLCLVSTFADAIFALCAV